MFDSLLQTLRGYQPLEVIIEMAVIWVCVYFIYRFLRGTRGAGVIKGLAVLLVLVTLFMRVVGQGTDTFGRLNFIYDRFLQLLAILLIVVFQPELRQAMIRLGHTTLFRQSRSDIDQMIDAIVEAVGFLAKSQFGAIIAIERNVRLGGLTEGGIRLDARIDARLLESIFWPNSPLHDLGVVVRGNRILAASVQFPLVEEGAMSKRLGSRHRAAVGITLEADCIVVVVSEERGTIGIAENGRLLENINAETLSDELRRRLSAPSRDKSASALDNEESSFSDDRSGDDVDDDDADGADRRLGSASRSTTPAKGGV